MKIGRQSSAADGTQEPGQNRTPESGGEKRPPGPLDFNPIEIRGEPQSATVLCERGSREIVPQSTR